MIFFSGFYIPLEEIPEKLQWLIDVSITKHCSHGVLHAIYAHGRCPPDKISFVLHKYHVEESQLWSTYTLALLCIGFRIFALLALLINNIFVDVQTVKKWIQNRRLKPVVEI